MKPFNLSDKVERSPFLCCLRQLTRISQDITTARKLVRSRALRKAGMIYLKHQAAVYTSRTGRQYTIYGSPVRLSCVDIRRLSYTYLQAAPFFSIGAFQYNWGDGKAIYDRIPPATDILLTHTPPLRTCDVTKGGANAGCPELAERLSHRDLENCRLHVFGHIHEAHGATIVGQTMQNPNGRVAVNAALPRIPLPIIVDLKD